MTNTIINKKKITKNLFTNNFLTSGMHQILINPHSSFHSILRSMKQNCKKNILFELYCKITKICYKNILFIQSNINIIFFFYTIQLFRFTLFVHKSSGRYIFNKSNPQKTKKVTIPEIM